MVRSLSSSGYDAPVLIVGGGPTGLATALFLARQGVLPLLVERHAGIPFHPRARGLNVRTMEILRAVGLEDAVRAAGSALAASRYMLFVETLAGQEIRRVLDADLLPVGEDLARITPCDWCRCAQDDLELILAGAARTHGADLRFGTDLVSVSQDTDGVSATVTEHASGRTRTVRARYLVAADGARSSIREGLGVAMRGLAPGAGGPLGHFVNIYFRAELSHLVQGREFMLCFVEGAGAEGLLLAVNNADRWLFNIAYDPQRGETPAAFTPQRCIERIRAAVGLPDLAVEILSVLPWTGAALLAERFQVGRVFLAGDAAHVMPPAGGFGLNTGVQDAHNLAWKLAAVLADVAAPALLDTYEAERRPVAGNIVGRAAAEFTAPAPDARPSRNGPAGDERDGGAWEDAEGDPLDQLSPILGFCYQSPAVVGEDGDSAGGTVGMHTAGLDVRGRPGTRAPHVWIERGDALVSTLDLFDGRFVLLSGAEGAEWRDAARRAATLLDLPLDAYCVGAGGDLLDHDGAWAQAYGVTSVGAVIVRPDGVVGWRSRGAGAPTGDMERVVTRLLCREPQPAVHR